MASKADTLRDCECADKECPAHTGTHCKIQSYTDTLYRIDMEDQTGTEFCTECANDALDSGLFSYEKGSN